MCVPRVGPSLYSFTPGLTHMLLAASSLCWISSTWEPVLRLRVCV